MSADWVKDSKARCEAATPGPWRVSDSHGLHVRGGGDGVMPSGVMVADLEQCAFHGDEASVRVDAELIANARTDLPRALACIEAADALVGHMEGIMHLAGTGACPPNCMFHRLLAAYQKARHPNEPQATKPAP